LLGLSSTLFYIEDLVRPRTSTEKEPNP